MCQVVDGFEVGLGYVWVVLGACVFGGSVFCGGLVDEGGELGVLRLVGLYADVVHLYGVDGF